MAQSRLDHPRPLVVVTAKVTPSQALQLRLVAMQIDRPVSAVVRVLLADWLAGRPALPTDVEGDDEVRELLRAAT